MPDDKEVERLAQKFGGAHIPLNTGDPEFDRGECSSRCVACKMLPALRSAMRIGEKRAYEDAVKGLREKAARLRRPPTDYRNRDIAEQYEGAAYFIQAKADSLKGE